MVQKHLENHISLYVRNFLSRKDVDYTVIEYTKERSALGFEA